MARIFTFTGRGGDIGTTLLGKHFTLRTQSGKPAIAYNALMGGYCLDLSTFGCAAEVPLSPAKSEIYLSFMVISADQIYSSLMLEFTLGSTSIATLIRYNVSLSVPQFPSIGCYKGHNATWIAGCAGINNSQTHPDFYEVYFKPAVTTGRWVVKVNGRTVIDFTGTTVPGSESTIDGVHFGCAQYTNNVYYQFNDIVIDDANWPGSYLMERIAPAGAGNYTQWSPSAGANHECVEEFPPLSSDYVKTNSADQSDSYAPSDLPVTADSVKGVTVIAWGVKENAPTPTQTKPLLRTGGTPTDYVGDGVALGIYETLLSKTWETNPFTEAGWTVEEVNGMEIGVKSAA